MQKRCHIRVGSSRMAMFPSLARYIIRTFTFKAIVIILYYVDPCWLVIDTETDNLECAKVCLGLGT